MTRRFLFAMGALGALGLAAAISLPAPAASAAVYYVDPASPNCSNSGPGTAASPYCTISAAVAAHSGAGTTIQVLPGTYPEQVTIPASGATGNPFVLQASGSVVVDGADDVSGTSKWTLLSGNVWRAGSVTWSVSQVFVDGARLKSSSASPGSLPTGTFRYVSGAGLYANIGGGNPGSRQVRVSRRSHGFRLSGKSWVTITGFTVTRTEDRSIYLSSGSNNCVLSNNAVTFSRRYGIGISECTGVLIASNMVSDNQDHGISLSSSSTGCTVQDNESCRNVDPSERRANGIYLNKASGNTVRRNRVHHNQDTGFQINTSSNNNVFHGNISWSNGDHGFDHLNSSTGTIHRHDVAYGNFKDGFSIEGGATGTSLFNCIGVNNGLTEDNFDLWVDSGSASGFVSNYNLFWNSTSKPPVKYISTIYSSVAAYSAATGKDAQSIQSNPRFVNPAAGDFHLLAGSPAIDNANSSVSQWPATDAEGRARIDDPGTPNTGIGPVPYADRGALEFVGISLPPVVAAPASASGAEAAPISVPVTASDPDGDPISSLTANLSALPAGNNAAFSAGAGNTSGTLTWTPTYADARATPYNAVFTASNGYSGSSTTAITVTNVDRAPVVAAAASVSVGAGKLLTLPVSASDPDGNAISALTADTSGLPSGNNASFTTGPGNASGTLTWTPVLAHVRAAPYLASFTASNALSGSATTAITVTDLDAPPTVVAPAAVGGTEGLAVSIVVTDSDPDGDAIASLTADASGLPAGNNAAFTAGAGNTSGTLTWTPASGDARPAPYSVAFSAANAGSGTAVTAITVTAGGTPGDNLVGNPSFESSTAGWSANGGSTLLRVSGGFDGAFALEVRAPATGTGKFGVNDSPNWIVSTPGAGVIYRYTAWVRSAGSAGLCEVRVREYLGGVQQGATTYSPGATLSSVWQMVTVDHTAGTAGGTLDFQVLDSPAVPGEIFQVDDISIHVVAGGAASSQAPRRQSLNQLLAPVLAPNPPHPDATLAFTTTRQGKVQVRIYDTGGRLVRRLLDEASMPAGRHVVRFDGRDESGRRLASGIYFYRLDTREGSTRGRIVRVQ